jgi:hypothetical protein
LKVQGLSFGLYHELLSPRTIMNREQGITNKEKGTFNIQ